MQSNDDIILEILQGQRTAKWPKAKVVKIFVASDKKDFVEERRLLLEFVGPELQIICDEYQIEVEIVDMHFGASERDGLCPRTLEDHLSEIKKCHEVSRGCFFISLIGSSYGQCSVPARIEDELFSELVKEDDAAADILRKWYIKDGDCYNIKDYGKLELPEWKVATDEIINALRAAGGVIEDKEAVVRLLRSTVEHQFNYAIELSEGAAHRMVNIIREFHYEHGHRDATAKHSRRDSETFKANVNSLIPEENQCHFTVPYKGDGSIDPDDEDHEIYLNKFKSMIFKKLQMLVKKSVKEDPDLKSRKKIVEENFQENITHLTMNYEDVKMDFSNSDIVNRIKEIVKGTTDSRHNPIVIYGQTGTGKTSLVKTLYRDFASWFDCKLLRIVRYISSTPRSAYNLELLRVICQQICIALKLPEGFLPKDASFDPLYINNWFQSLLRIFEDMNQKLVIFIDDLHLLNTLDTDPGSGLNWLPISLPRNCFLICTTGVELDAMRLTAVQKDRMKNPDCYLELPMADDSLSDQVESAFDELESLFGKPAVARLSALLTCSEYGFTETELLEILMPTSSNVSVISLENANFNFSTFCTIRRNMKPLLHEKVMNGKLIIEWRHWNIKGVARKRYLQNQETIRNTHTDIANIFFNEFCEEETSESEDEPAPLRSDVKETPFQSTIRSDVTYSTRHIEESWIHFLKSGDLAKLKGFTLCNYDFLLAVVHTISISYMRCILEHVRCYILDREIELVYHAIRKATDILTKDTYQLGTQIITWLRPVTDRSSSGGLMNSLVTAAMAWCDGFTLPLVVPLTDWLQPPLPSHSRTINTPQVYLVESTPNGQHVICCADSDPQLWHIMTNQLVHTFKGHSGKVICMAVTRQSQYLLTGSEDTSIIVWDLRALTMTLRIFEHIAPVLCITSALNNSVIVSGGDDSSIIVTSLGNGKLVMKIDHHRGPVTSVKVTSAGDILVSGSQDGNVCLWSLEDFTILNTISLQSGVRMIDVSSDSVFLLASCMDNNLHLRTLATGTELHSLAEHKSRVKSVCLTQDSCRAVVGCSDGRVYIYDVHSGKLAKTLTGQNGEVSAVRVTEKDDFLLTAGGNRVHFYPFRSDDTVKSLLKLNKKSQHHLLPHTGYLTCIDVSRDGLLAATGATDHLINIWQLNSHELILTLNSHSGSVTAVSFAPSSLFVASASEDKTVKVWGLTLGSLVSTFKGHQAPVITVHVMMDSSRIISSDRNDTLCIWLADNGNLLHSYTGPSNYVDVTNNMKYALCTNADNTLKIWSLIKDDEKFHVGHSEEITCFVLTMDSLHVITGSRDMSLKVWQVSGGKLSQVLIGHTDAVTCVAVSVADKSLIISGSCDSNLIVWDINTGADVHTLSAHLSYITCVKCSGDGSIAISGSDDKSLIIWDTKRGLPLTSLQMHLPILQVETSSDFSRISVLLKDTQYMPIICLHNTPAKYVKLPTYCAPDKDIIDNPKPAPKRQMRRLLKKEVSLDTYTWQKKYAHLTSNLVIPAVDERFKRRFSVSASMEEISKIPQKDGQPGLPNKQGSLAQSQHFDQLEALWNKRSPPRRKLHQSLSKQSSLAESHLDSSDDDHF
ncbi:PREDICTED: NACHT domain- and WD repeat-containing protein 1 [Nicrophorus vespilloides]|uniref:NACHT domain- and WD repeat-containing protein 1 n=1 Tax=Nicrophorus vespilloides TaxID=110193 RepID=A0ABM1MGJ6_NICVS|nr:PREDICTED: NACHT domain- and WD repeat-containing protein 1 [Nicrophorus vespilloides]